MGVYVARRILWILPVLLMISLITFVLMHNVPGGPWDSEKRLAPAIVENLNRRYNLDKPAWQQYLLFLAGTVRADLGVSYSNQDRPVTEVIRDGFPISATIGLIALCGALVVGISLGTVAGLKPNSAVDFVALGFATAGASIPSIVSGVLLIILFSLNLHWFPTGGWQSPEAAWEALRAGNVAAAAAGFWAFCSRIALPALALAFAPAALIARVTRASVLEVTRQEFVRTARAKGLADLVVVGRHVLKNAMIPVITLAGPIAAELITGSFIVESIFGIPGLGRTFVQAVGARDYALILGMTLFYTVLIALANLLVDILYGVVDPRIRYA
jgi:oligopeptide transport system permease protein